MKNNIKTVAMIILSMAVGVAGTLLVFNEKTEVGEDESTVEGNAARTIADGKHTNKVVKIRNKKTKTSVKIDEKRIANPAGSASANGGDGTAAEEAEEEKLTEVQKTVMRELQEALDANDFNRVKSVLKKYAASAKQGNGNEKVPVCIRAKAVSALGWFGRKAATELFEYVADPNEEVAQEAFNQFEQALSDGEMGDMERSQIVTTAMKTLNDAEQVDSLLSQFSNMRNSVKADTAKEILANGTDAAKAKLQEQMDFYFDEAVVDAGTLDAWKVQNPDAPEDNELYGGKK